VLVAEAGAILARGCAVELLANVVAQAPTAFSATRGAAALEAVGARVLQEASLRGVHGAAPGRGARSGGGGGSGQQQREEGRHRIVFELAVEVSRKRAMRFLGVLIENLHTKCYTTIYAKLKSLARAVGRVKKVAPVVVAQLTGLLKPFQHQTGAAFLPSFRTEYRVFWRVFLGKSG
jgi:hypothetical protein